MNKKEYQKLKGIFLYPFLQDKENQEYLYIAMLCYDKDVIKLATESLLTHTKYPLLLVLKKLYCLGIAIDQRGGFLLAECITFWQGIPHLQTLLLKEDKDFLYGEIMVSYKMTSTVIKQEIKESFPFPITEEWLAIFIVKEASLPKEKERVKSKGF
ncbi:MAG: hypothetical protein PHN72_03060 [Bacilli bacterium]|nr:hypothetical protein [Bacilli bacterium]